MAGLPDLKFILYEGNDITGLARGLEDELANDTEESDTAGTTVQTHRHVGTAAHNVKVTGFYDADLSPVFEASPEGVLMYVLLGNTAGQPCECAEEAKVTRYKRLVEGKAMHKAEIDFQANDALDHSLLIAALAARGAAGDTTAADLDTTAATTSGGRLWVSVPALDLDGYTNVEIQVQDSADGNSFADVAPAVATLTAAGAALVTFTGTIRRYVAIAWSYGGAGTTPSVTFAAALTKIPDA